MKLKFGFSVFLVFLGQMIFSQNNTSIGLKEVYVSTHNNSKFKVNKNQKFTDSILKNTQPVLGDLLKNNTLIYFKEYGQGMLSTVSFRGTTASQTAVLWNGININSPLNGSTDFNTISVNGIQSVEVKAGGGSVVYGSGAIGGSIHLNNELFFGHKKSFLVNLSAGSFGTYSTSFFGSISTPKTALNFGLSHLQSQNDYPYKGLFNWLGQQRKNLNGQYEISELNVSFGHKISSKSSLKLYSQTSYNDRNLVLTTEADPIAKYRIQYSRNLVDYDYRLKKIVFNPKVAYFTERYQYFPDNSKLNQYSFGESNTFLGRLNLNYDRKKTKLFWSSEYNVTHGFGGSFGDNHRKIFSQSISFDQKIAKNWNLEGGLRKEFTHVFESPLLFSLGSISNFKFYTFKIALSKNFRIPTFNDLYWDGLGNPDLKPEKAIQGEIIHEFKVEKIKITLTNFYNDISQMIRWVPQSSDVWRPVNVDKVRVFGGEVMLNVKLKWLNDNLVDVNSGYSYTSSKNIETDKQLFFTPYHKFFGNINYYHKKVSLFIQNVYTGKVYTTSDNSEEYIIKPYLVSNAGIEYGFLKKKIMVKGIVNNMLDIKYSSIDKPMPGRNFNCQLIFKY